MSLSEKSKQSIRAWDRENMRTLSCRVRTDEAEVFKQYCLAHETTAVEVLKKYVAKCIYEYGEELRKAEQEGK